jgi:hypothetical protein
MLYFYAAGISSVCMQLFMKLKQYKVQSISAFKEVILNRIDNEQITESNVVSSPIA